MQLDTLVFMNKHYEILNDKFCCAQKQTTNKTFVDVFSINFI